MGCYHESEPATVENLGLDSTSVQKSAPEGQIDCPLHLFKEESIAEKPEGKESKTVGQRREIFSLYDEFRPRLFGYIRSYGLTSDQAEEIIQEIFLRLTTEVANEKDIGNVEGWIIRVARNLAVNARIKIESDASHVIDVSSIELETFVDPKEGPYERYLKKEQLRRMEAALLTLNPQQRRCFSLRVEGFNYKDIGRALGISEQRAALILKQVAVRLAGLLQVGGTKVE